MGAQERMVRGTMAVTNNKYQVVTLFWGLCLVIETNGDNEAMWRVFKHFCRLSQPIIHSWFSLNRDRDCELGGRVESEV